ncbi:hypothetical protein EV130_109274 [Rhizobium azibense]|uniref:Uncharacterized protein n=1 Tax=Rhizobium azibense TaxID=1136135 RepID=A0A4R3QN51_9HYPH|nr:hypothetical protein [Rhizobium azibense]TCU22477.1 hypothetical protein EV130_109274 [Rhizobium azibense]
MQGAPESNGDWSNYKPHGELSMTVTNPVAIEQFEIGGVYRLTFEKAGASGEGITGEALQRTASGVVPKVTCV